MSLVRTIKCTVCGETFTEDTHGNGFPDWCIINGIAEEKPEEGKSLTNENMSCYLCPDHRDTVSDFIESMVDAHKGSIIKGAE